MISLVTREEEFPPKIENFVCVYVCVCVCFFRLFFSA